MNRAEKRRQQKLAQKAAISQSLDLALEHHSAGRLAEAENLYKSILQTDGNQHEALHMLGVIAHQVGKNDIAVDLISRSLAIERDSFEAHNNIGNALQELGRLEEAIDNYHKALVINPDSANGHNNLGISLKGLGRLDEAIASYHKALAIEPDHPEAHNNLGIALAEQGKLDEAVASYNRALAINADDAQAHNHLGVALNALWRLDDAVASFIKALAIKPAYAEAFNNLGATLSEMGRLEDAVASFQKALAIRADYAEAYNNLATTYNKLGRLPEAAANFHKVLAINPDYLEAHGGLGVTLKETGDLEGAIASFRKALAIDADFHDGAVGLLHQLRQTCAWSDVAGLEPKVKEMAKRLVSEGADISFTPFDNVISCPDGLENFKQARGKSNAIAKKMAAFKADFKFADNGLDKPRITIGYLSSDFQNHPTAHLMQGLFGLHERTDFNVLAFSYGRNDDSAYRKKISNDCDQFFDLEAASHVKAAQQIFQSGVDILVDLKGHTYGSRMEICALRPAPVQVSYLGFPGTTGADFLDYFITDRIVTPADQAPHYSEQLVYLPDSYQITDHRQKISDAPLTREDCNLPEAGFVFCSFNSNYKIEPVMFDLWMNLLKKVPASVLWLFRSNTVAERNLKAEAEARGVHGERLIFAQKLPKDQHLARCRLADLALDTRICGGHTTTTDALWAGLPVVTMAGVHFPSRVAASLLGAVGLPELITANLQDYEALAYRLSQNPGELADLKTRLADNRLSAPLFDTPRFVRNLENAYRRMWEIHQSGEPPCAIDLGES